MVDLPPLPPQWAFVELEKSSNSDIRDRINVIRVSFEKARGLAQSGNAGLINLPADPQGDPVVAQFDNFNQALPFQNFNQFANFNDFSNFNDFTNFNDFSNQ